jgi:hypothetical protein
MRNHATALISQKKTLLRNHATALRRHLSPKKTLLRNHAMALISQKSGVAKSRQGTYLPEKMRQGGVTSFRRESIIIHTHTFSGLQKQSQLIIPTTNHEQGN